MQFVHHDLGHQSAGAVVEVEVGERVNVQLVDAANFNAYRRDRPFRYIGGEALRSPLRFEIPHADHWHVVVDLGGGSGRIHSSARVLDYAA